MLASHEFDVYKLVADFPGIFYSHKCFLFLPEMWGHVLFWAFLLTTLTYVCVGIVCALCLRTVRKGIGFLIPLGYLGYGELVVLSTDAIASKLTAMMWMPCHNYVCLVVCMYIICYTCISLYVFTLYKHYMYYDMYVTLPKSGYNLAVINNRL